MYPEISKFSEKFKAIYRKYSGDKPQDDSWEDFEHFLFEVWSDGYETALRESNSMEDDEDGTFDKKSPRRRKANRKSEKYSLSSD